MKELIGELSIPEKYTINQTTVNTSWNDIVGKPDFAKVAESGNYNDLINKPEIPSINGLATKQELNAKQNKLTAGDNITIVDNVISSTASGGGGGSVTGYAYTVGQQLTENDIINIKQAMNNGLIPFTINNELVTGCYTDKLDHLHCITQPRGSKEPKLFHHGYWIPLDSLPRKVYDETPPFEMIERKNISWPISFSTPVGGGEDKTYDWLVDYAKNPSCFYLTINNNQIAYHMKKNDYQNYITIYAIGRTDNSQYNGLNTYTIYFTDNTFSALDKTKTYSAQAGERFITSLNWQNYITISGGSNWIYSNTSDSSLYNAQEIVILWDYNGKKYCNYYKLSEGETLGGYYTSQDFWAEFIDTSGTEAYWSYDGTQINGNNMNINWVIFKI